MLDKKYRRVIFA